MSSWFHRLRRKAAGAGAIACTAVAEPPAAPPCSPNRASYYVPSRDRALALPRREAADRENNPNLRDTRFPRSPQPSDIVFDVVASRRDDRFSAAVAPDLKLRPIVTRLPPRPDADASSAAASPTGRARPPPRFHFDAAKGGTAAPDHHRRDKAEEEKETVTWSQSQNQSRSRRRRLRRAGRLRWVYESLVVVKESADPEEDFLESMAEMIAANGVRSPRGLEELLACYLALNAADHHLAIVAAFRRAWLQLHHLHRAPPSTPTPPMELCCMHEHESCVVVD